MPYNYGFGASGGNQGSSGIGGTDVVFGRVVEVVYDGNSEAYGRYDKSNSINGIVFRPLAGGRNNDDILSLKFAYCVDPSYRRVPLVNEVIRAEGLPAETGRESDSGVKNTTGPTSYLCGTILTIMHTQTLLLIHGKQLYQT